MATYYKSSLAVSLAMACLILSPAQLMAQVVPSTAEPGIVSKDLQKQLPERQRSSDIVVIDKDAAEGKNLSTEKVFTLQGVVLEGSSVYNQADVDRVAGQYVGQKVSFADINAISAAITKKYREDGYVLSRAVVSPQKVKGGVVHLKVIEGRISDVKVIGTYRDEFGVIADMAAKIKSDGPSNERDIERYLLLIDDLPGVTARSVLKPSATPGAGDLIITIEEDMFEAALGVDNRGSRYLGPYRGTAVGAVNSLFGIHDRTTVRGLMSSDVDELKFGDITHEEQIGSEGIRVKARYAKTSTQPGSTLLPLNIEGDSDLFDLEGFYPAIRSRQQNLNFTAGFNALNSKSDVLGINTATDRVRSLRVGGHYDVTDDLVQFGSLTLGGINEFEVVLTHGIDVFNATPNGLGRSRANGEQGFFHTNASATRVQDLSNGFSVKVAAEGQYSADPLLASEEFAVGGPDNGRAYDSGEITGDSGMAGNIELRFSGPSPHPFLKSYQVFTYFDGGKVWNTKPVVGELPTDSLTSAGLGVRFNVDYDVSGSLEVDKPITRTVSSEGDRAPRVFFSLLKRF